MTFGQGQRLASVAIVLLAAGRASRMGESGAHKLLAEIEGIPLVRRAAQAAVGSAAATVVAVTGYRQDEIRAAMAGLNVHMIENPDYASGMASSLIAGVQAAASGEEHAGADGVLVMLADMPWVTSADLDALIDAFVAGRGVIVVRAASAGKRGNPVILPRSTFAAIAELEGDVGARNVIEASGLPVFDIEIGPAAHLDLDTPEAILAAGGILKG